MSSRARHARFGAPSVGAEKLLGRAVLTAESAPTLRLQGTRPVEAFPSVRWMLSKPSDVASYDVQLYRWSETQEEWIADGDPYTGLTTSRTIEQAAGAPLFCRIYGFGVTSATGFTKTIQGYNDAAV